MNLFKKLFQGFIDVLMILWDRLFHRPHRKPVVSDADLAAGLPAEKKEPSRAKKFLFKEYLPNMPKRQPYPQCQSGAARFDKKLGGASYNCRKHGKFLIAA